MNIPDPTILRKAIAIKTELEHLDHQLHELLATASSQDSVMVSKVIKKPLKEISEEALHASEKENETVLPETEATTHQDVIGVLSSSEPHQETLLLVDDDGEEQLAVTPEEEVCQFDPQTPLKESCYTPHGFDQATDEV